MLGTIKNLTVENISIQSNPSWTGGAIGTIVGLAENATIENCHSVCNYSYNAANSPLIIGGIVGTV